MSFTYYIDIDGTICTQISDGDYSKAKPIKSRIEKVNEWFFQGNKIVYWTSRGMFRFNSDVQKCYEHFYDLTHSQLIDWGCRFDKLMMGKPMYDFWIDDKAKNLELFFGKEE